MSLMASQEECGATWNVIDVTRNGIAHAVALGIYGRKLDVEIPFIKEEGNNVVNVKARTIRPDGSIVNFEGKPFEKSIVKAKGLKYMAKTFTLPDVPVGGIIEYSYTIDLPELFLVNSHWILSNELFTRHAKFSLKPYANDFNVTWNWQGLPEGCTAQVRR